MSMNTIAKAYDECYLCELQVTIKVNTIHLKVKEIPFETSLRKIEWQRFYRRHGTS